MKTAISLIFLNIRISTFWCQNIEIWQFLSSSVHQRMCVRTVHVCQIRCTCVSCTSSCTLYCTERPVQMQRGKTLKITIFYVCMKLWKLEVCMFCMKLWNFKVWMFCMKLWNFKVCKHWFGVGGDVWKSNLM